MKNKYPVGATWESKSKHGTSRIWLDHINGDLEVWRWCTFYSDGSGYESDWAPSKSGVRNECVQQFEMVDGKRKYVRFKRVK